MPDLRIRGHNQLSGRSHPLDRYWDHGTSHWCRRNGPRHQADLTMSAIAFYSRAEAEAYAAEAMEKGCYACIVVDGEIFVVQLWDRKT